MSSHSLNLHDVDKESSEKDELSLSGFELEEVDFSQFDRRKAPRRLNNSVVFDDVSGLTDELKV